MAHSFALSILPLLFLVVQATNDWTTPCFQGECSYDLLVSSDGITPAAATVHIEGSAHAISDITAAAGWTIIDCDPNALAQDIRLVCHDDSTATGCDHLFQSSGPVGKIVRLPENCGKSAFARIAQASAAEDQSSSFTRRDGSQQQVHSLSLDTNFAAVNPATSGSISIRIIGSTIPGANSNMTVTPPTSTSGPQRQSRLAGRNAPGFVESAFAHFGSFNKTLSHQDPAIQINNKTSVINEQIACPAVGQVPATSASIKGDMKADMNAVIEFGVAVTGTIVPPKLTSFGLYAGLNAVLDGTLNISANISGTISSPTVTLYEVGIPGLDFPGILSVGPTFKINTLATATLDVDLDMVVDLSYNVSNAKLYFPPSSQQQSGGDFTPANTPLQLSVSPVASSATLTAHLVPTISFGISALSGLASTTVFLDLDASASLDLSLYPPTNATASEGPNTTGNTSSQIVSATSESPNTTGNTSSQIVSATSAGPATTAFTGTPSATLTATSTTTSAAGSSLPYSVPSSTNSSGTTAFVQRAVETDAAQSDVAADDKDSDDRNDTSGDVVSNLSARDSVDGCVEVQVGLAVKAGAQGKFFNLFTASTTVSLFAKQFELFKRCYGDGDSINSKRSIADSIQRSSPSLQKRTAITCHDANSVVSITSVVVPSTNITSL